jgi:hypothetical protein
MDDARKIESVFLPAWPSTEFGLHAARQMLERGECVTSAIIEWQADATRFVNQRAGRNSETFTHMTRCQGVTELLDLELQWMRTAMDDYAGQARKLLEINGRVFDRLAAGLATTVREIVAAPDPPAPMPAPAVKPMPRRQQAEPTEASAA